MAAVISLREVIEALEMQGDDCASYLDPDTGEIITVTREERDLAEETEESLEDVPEWQRQMLPKVRAVLASDRCLQMPGRFEIHEWSIMDEFAQTRHSERMREELLDAIHGAGAFRMFRSTIRRLGIENSWYKFREEAFAEIARNWLEEHKLSYR
jgi:NurA-like 5'-3' nuclease